MEIDYLRNIFEKQLETEGMRKVNRTVAFWARVYAPCFCVRG